MNEYKKMSPARSIMEVLGKIFENDIRIVDEQPLYGGDINQAYRLVLSNGQSLFMKCNRRNRMDLFEAERLGLWCMAGSQCVRVPEVLGYGTDEGRNCSFLILPFLDSAAPNPDYWERFGRELALMHRWNCGELLGERRFGFVEDNFIGLTPQKNTPQDSWTAFYRECRLVPQFQMAERWFDAGSRAKMERLLANLEQYLPEPEFPSLLHGDLWRGNVHRGRDGAAWVIDPACSIGHYETDLAMTLLFGGFPDCFYQAYQEILPIGKDFYDRVELYHLYHLLNHLNLFGEGYLASVRTILDKFG